MIAGASLALREVTQSEALLATPGLARTGGQDRDAFLRNARRAGLADTAALTWAMGHLSGLFAPALDLRYRGFRRPQESAESIRAYCCEHPRTVVERAAESLFEPDTKVTPAG